MLTQAGTRAASCRLRCVGYLNLQLYSDLQKLENWHKMNFNLTYNAFVWCIYFTCIIETEESGDKKITFMFLIRSNEFRAPFHSFETMFTKILGLFYE